MPRTGSVLVTIIGKGTVVGPVQWKNIPLGTAVELTAMPDSGSMFTSWSGDIRSTENPLTVIIQKDMALICAFGASPPDMRKIAASGKTFSMGSLGALAAINEKPAHQVKFTYDYFMDACEITLGEYNRLMGITPSQLNAAQSPVAIDDSLPVNYVRWYDAVLFCNAKSKKNGYDTVYSFSAVCNSSQTCPYVLENCSAHYDRLGYRLPTEAEWEFACRAGTGTDYFWNSSGASNGDYAWFVENSKDQPHPVGTKLPNAFGLYDMAGNLAEWVNDWCGAYPDSLAVNPVGPTALTLEQFELSWQRPIRGGCYSLGSSFLRSSNRSGAYPVIATTSNKHIGFRTVIGMFFTDSVKSSVFSRDSLSVTLSCNKSDVLSFVGTSRIKVAFTIENNKRERNLYYLDFTRPDAKIRPIQDTITAHKPVISPNGAFVAYGSKQEGFPSSSIMTVRHLDSDSLACIRTPELQSAFLPKWFVDPQTLDTFLIFSDGASMNQLLEWASEKTFKQKFSNFSLQGFPEVICINGSFTGGISRDGQFLATGYPKAMVYDIKERKTVQYFLPPYNGRDDTAQVCNLSISPGFEAPDELMFLDFGYPRISSIVGKPYRFHSVIFIANSISNSVQGKIRWYEVPSGFESWDRIQWSNHPDFAVAVCEEQQSTSKRSVFLIDLKKSRYLKVAFGEGIGDPYLWIDPLELPDKPDPYLDFGKYSVPCQSSAQYCLDFELKHFWALRKELECGFLGSSQVIMTIDPSCITKIKTVLMGAPGLDVVTELMLIKNYFLPHAPKLKVIAVSLDPGWIPIDYSRADPHDLGFAKSRGLFFDSAHTFWKSGIPPEVQNKIATFGPTSWPELDSSGKLSALGVGNGWGTALYDGGDYTISDPRVQTYMSLMQALSDTLANRGIHLLLVKFPEHPDYKKTGYVSRYGPTYATYNQLVDWLRELEKTNLFFHFYDANMNGDHDYTDAEAGDCNHLNVYGRKKISPRIDSVISSFLP
jgi:formylglycine-generating enzyme required for sulfatase activity